jgi:ribosomal protein S1
MKNNNVVVGVRVVGSVVEIRPYGVIAEFEGGSGLLHVSRLAGGSRRSRDRRLQRFAPGEKVEVDVLAVNDGKVTLSELYRDEAVIAGLEVGSEVTAKVVHKLDCALIVAIDAGVAAGYDGFVHVSELAGGSRKAHDERLAHAKIGQSLTLSVLHVGRDDRGDLSIKLSESLVALRRKLATSFAVGTTHTGTVRRRTEAGFVVSFGEFSGFLPEREAGASVGSIRVGGGVKTKVLEIGADLSITLTRKGL